MISHTISITELLWTLFCGVGLFFNTRILLRAVGDLTYLRARKINSLREYSARLTVFTYASWALVQLAFTAVGAVAMSQPPAKGSSQAVTTFQIVLTTVFIMVSFLLASSAAVNEIGRRNLLDKMKEYDL